MKELIEKFEKETGLEFYTTNLDKGEDLYSYDFVNWLIKQLPIQRVVSSLPSKEEMEIKLDYLIENKPDAFNKYDEITFRFGFRTCFYWLDKKLRK